MDLVVKIICKLKKSKWILKNYFNFFFHNLSCCYMKINLIFTSLLITIFYSCNLTYKVRNQSHELEEVLHLPCGRIYIELIGKGDSKFSFRQKFELENNVRVFPDSLHIFWNDHQISPEHNLRNGKKSYGAVLIRGKKEWVSSFELDEGVFEGDTIFVFGNSYLQCGEDTVSLDTLIYAFDNNFRIFGVNEFKSIK